MLPKEAKESFSWPRNTGDLQSAEDVGRGHHVPRAAPQSLRLWTPRLLGGLLKAGQEEKPEAGRAECLRGGSCRAWKGGLCSSTPAVLPQHAGREPGMSPGFPVSRPGGETMQRGNPGFSTHQLFQATL